MSVRILAVGDVCGQPGLDFLEKRLKEYKKEQNIAFAVVNGETQTSSASHRGRPTRSPAPVQTLSRSATTHGHARSFSPTLTSGARSCARQISARSARGAASTYTPHRSAMSVC